MIKMYEVIISKPSFPYKFYRDDHRSLIPLKCNILGTPLFLTDMYTPPLLDYIDSRA